MESHSKTHWHLEFSPIIAFKSPTMRISRQPDHPTGAQLRRRFIWKSEIGHRIPGQHSHSRGCQKDACRQLSDGQTSYPHLIQSVREYLIALTFKDSPTILGDHMAYFMTMENSHMRQLPCPPKPNLLAYLLL